jgi:hypothetical protein
MCAAFPAYMRQPLEQVAAVTSATVPETVRHIVMKELFERQIEQSRIRHLQSDV